MDKMEIDPAARPKRTCLFNGGMSHSCDYKDVLGAMKEASYWNSDMSPGRKKRAAINTLTDSIDTNIDAKNKLRNNRSISSAHIRTRTINEK
jgi:hypothetical protein